MYTGSYFRDQLPCSLCFHLKSVSNPLPVTTVTGLLSNWLSVMNNLWLSSVISLSGGTPIITCIASVDTFLYRLATRKLSALRYYLLYFYSFVSCIIPYRDNSFKLFAPHASRINICSAVRLAFAFFTNVDGLILLQWSLNCSCT